MIETNKTKKSREKDALGTLQEELVNKACQTTQKIVKTTMEVGTVMGDITENTAKATQQLIELGTTETGKILTNFAENPLLKWMSDTFGTNWLKTMLGGVNTEQVQQKVLKLQEKYPQEKPEEIAHRLMVQKAYEAGRIGLLTNIIPPIAAAFIGIELLATASLQGEMLYEIAAAYGLDLKEPARRGEVLAIFALSLGGNMLKGGLNLVEIIPGIGAVIGASTNAILLYSLGYTACKFYERKGKLSPATVASLQQESDKYWQSANGQSAIMDQVLVHMILASYPDKSWSDILPALKKVSPSSVKVVAIHLENPQPLDILLEKLSPDLAILLLGRCYSLALLEGVITPEEQQVLDKIATKFAINLNTFSDDFEEH